MTTSLTYPDNCLAESSNGILPLSYTWDPDNRLVSVSSVLPSSHPSVPIATYAYDHLGRRVLKSTPDETRTFLYDGWNLISETIISSTPNSSLLTTNSIHYLWGLDLSGTMQGAGGVGGLLAVIMQQFPSGGGVPEAGWSIYIPCYDANGNITQYLDLETGAVVAQYDYDPYGNLLSSSGPLADLFSHRFSTKYYDPETGNYYYGYRYYRPEWQSWISADPIGERGGLNLYGFVRNNPINKVDRLGLSWISCKGKIASGPTVKEGAEWKLVSDKPSVQGKAPGLPGFITGGQVIDGVTAKWELEGSVKCCCTKFLGKFSDNRTRTIYKTKTVDESFHGNLIVVGQVNMGGPLSSLGTIVRRALSLKLSNTFRDNSFASKWVIDGDPDDYTNAIKSSEPATLEEGEWPSNPCK